MCALLRKFIARFFHFMFSLIDLLKRMTKFRIKFTLSDIKLPTRLGRNIAAVSANVNDDHQLSIRRRSLQLALCYSTTFKILQKNLGVKPFEI